MIPRFHKAPRLTSKAIRLPVAAAVILGWATVAPAASTANRGGAAPSDTREPVVLSPAARDRVLAEMRVMLESVAAITRSLAADDRAAIAKAARASGTATAADVDPHIEHALPESFRQLGMQAHQGFDALAAQAQGGAASDAMLKSLAGTTATCVACHRTYRLTERP